MKKKTWEEKNYQKPLCEFCPRTNFGNRFISYVGSKYSPCVEDLCEVAEEHKKEDEIFQQECRENEYLSIK